MMEPNTEAQYYPYVGFHFRVEIDGTDASDVRFQSVGGMNVQLQAETYKEGGELRFEHNMPTRVKTADLVLKRGIVHPGSSALTRWIQQCFKEYPIVPKNLTIKLMGEDRRNPLLTWKAEHVWPKSWKVVDLNAEKGEVVIETLELSVNRLTLQS